MSRLPSLAARNVGRNRRRSLITMLAVFVGVALVILLRGFIDGVGALMVADVVEGRSGALQVHRAGFVDNIEAVPTRLNLPYTPELIAKMKSVPGVTGVTGRMQFSGLVGNGLTQTMFIGRAIDVAREKDACPRAESVVRAGGAPLSKGDAAEVLVGYELAESFKLDVGKTVNLQTQSPSGRSNSMDLQIKGLSTSSFPFENKRVLTVPLPVAQSLLGLEGRVTEYALAVDDLSRLEEIRSALQAALGPEYEVHTWKELQTFVRDIINRQQFVMGLIAFVFFVVVLTIIANTMLMSVFERVREIGTMLAVGVRRGQVRLMFLFEAALLGLLGGLAGAGAGKLALALISRKGIPLALPGTSSTSMLMPNTTWRFIGLTVVVAMLGAVLAALWPAGRASRLNPVDALRDA